MRELENES